MPYLKRTVIAGDMIEVKKYFATNYGKKSTTRGVRSEKTPEKQKRVNEKKAEEMLTWTIYENFRVGDLHLVLTYKHEPTKEEARKIIKNALNRFRRVYKKQGKEFRYILVTEYKNTRLHHHLIVNQIDLFLLQQKWKEGMVRGSYLYGNYEKLSAYLIKETSKTFRDEDAVSKKRWSSSTNLRKPKIKKQIIKANKWNDIPKPIKGYYIVEDSIYNGTHSFTLHPYQTYMMKKIE